MVGIVIDSGRIRMLRVKRTRLETRARVCVNAVRRAFSVPFFNAEKIRYFRSSPEEAKRV